jgi:di- and tripeptidase
LQIDGQDIHQFAHYGYVHCMLLGKGILPEAPSEEVLVSGGGDGRILLWRIDPSSGGAISTICTLEDGREEGESILSLAREGTFLYSGRFDGEVNVWDLETRQLVRSLKATTGDVHTLTLGAGVLYAGGKSGRVQVRFIINWYLCGANDSQKFNEHYETITSFKAHDGLILASAFTKYKDKPTLVTGGNDDTIVIWEVRDCTEPNAVAKRNNNGWYTRLYCHSSTNISRSHARVVNSIRRVPHRLLVAKVSRRLPTRRIILEISLPELRRCYRDDQHC